MMHELLARYHARYERHGGKPALLPEGASITDYLEGINPGLVANADTETIFDSAPAFARPFVALITHRQKAAATQPEDGTRRLVPCGMTRDGEGPWIEGKSRAPLLVSMTEYATRVEQKGIRPCKTLYGDRAKVATFFADRKDAAGMALLQPIGQHKLKEFASLLGRLTGVSDFPAEGVTTSIFPVPKPGSVITDPNSPAYGKEMLRLVHDDRIVNPLMAEEGGFDLATLSELQNVVGHVFQYATSNGNAPVYIVNTDVKSQFHQLGAPCWLKPLFVIRAQTDGRGETMFVPAPIPMGWKLSPSIGHAVTWTMGVGTWSPEFMDKAKERFGWKDADLARYTGACHYSLAGGNIGELQTMPAFLPLKPMGQKRGRALHDGGLFVLLDNIFIITPHKQIAEYYSARLEGMSRQINLVLKVPPDVKTLVGTPADGGTDDFEQFVGIDFHYDRWHVGDKKQHAPWAEIGGVVAGRWLGTHRQLAAMLGFIMWDWRVRMVPLLENEDVMQLYHVATPRSAEEWDAPLAQALSVIETEALRGAYETALKKIEVQSWRPPQITDTILAAADASGRREGEPDSSEASEGRLGYAVFNKQSNRFRCTSARSEIAEGAPISLRELEAVQLLVKDLVERGGRDSVVVLAEDNTTVIAWLRRMWSDDAQARQMLKEIQQQLQKNNLHLFAYYIRSEENLADMPSREPDEARWADAERRQREDATRRMLQEHEKRALVSFTHAGGASRRERPDPLIPGSRK